MSDGWDNRESGDDWAVAVVHGVGTPEPGQTLDAVCEAIGCVKQDFDPADMHHVTGLNNDGAEQHTRHYKTSSGFVRVAEVFWGDISRISESTWGLIRSLVGNLFGLEYVCHAALRQVDGFTRGIVSVLFRLARWIILPLHLLGLVTACVFGIMAWLASSGYIQPGQDYLTAYPDIFNAVALTFVVAGLFFGIKWRIKVGKKRRFAIWDMALACSIIAGLSIAVVQPVSQNWFKTCAAEIPTKKDAQYISYGQKWLTGTPKHSFSGLVCRAMVESTPFHKMEGIGKYLALNEFASDFFFFVSAALAAMLFVIGIVYLFFASRPVRRALGLSMLSVFIFVIVLAIMMEPVDFVTRWVQHYTSNGNYRFFAYWYESMLVPRYLAA